MRIWAWTETSSAETGLIRNQESWLGGQGTSDGNPLTLSAAESMGKAALVRRSQPDHLQQFAHAVIDRPSLSHLMKHEWLADDVADVHARVQGREGILKDHTHRTADALHLLLRNVGDLFKTPVRAKADTTGCRLDQACNETANRCLAAAGLADKAKRLTPADRQIDAVYGADRPNLTSQKTPENRIVERDALNLQLGNFVISGCSLGSACRRFRPGQRDHFDSLRGINRRAVT